MVVVVVVDDAETVKGSSDSTSRSSEMATHCASLHAALRRSAVRMLARPGPEMPNAPLVRRHRLQRRRRRPSRRGLRWSKNLIETIRKKSQIRRKIR